MKKVILTFAVAMLPLSSVPASAGAPIGVEVRYMVGGNQRRIEEGDERKFNSPSCPKGFRIVAGGHRIVDVGTGDPNKIYVWWSWPDRNRDLWSTHVRNTADPVPGTAPLVDVEVTAICVESSN